MTCRERKHVVMFAAEASPFIKIGGLADVLGALPKVLDRMGVQVTVVLPAYQVIAREKFDIQPCAAISAFDVRVGPEIVRAEVSRAVLPGTGVEVFFLGGGGYFSREGVYDDPGSREGYHDNMRRFAFYSRAGLELLRRLDQPVDVLHCHDSQAGLIPGLLSTTHRDEPFFRRTGALFTIHNAAYQGLYEKEALVWAGIDDRYFAPFSPFEYWGKVNFMKVGILTADLVNTVSETYAREIQSGPEYGCGLENALKSRAEDLYGIVNGIDYDEWNPETDPLLPAHYSAQNLSGKAACKAALLQAVGLPRRERRIPLLGIISRMVDQKGFDLIGEASAAIAAHDLQMVVLGHGQGKYHELFETLSSRHPEKIAVRFGFNNPLAHQIEAGADMFLMPSRYEPCGLNQLYSLRYGTVPIVRATGGLADTIRDYHSADGAGTGFVFREYTAAEMMTAIERALALYREPGRWHRLAAHDMQQRWSWDESARKYLELYRKICEKKRS